MTIAKTMLITFFLGTFIFAADSTTTRIKTTFRMTECTLVAIDTTQKVIIINQVTGQDTFALDSKTIFSRYSEPIKDVDLKAEDTVTVHYRERLGIKTANRVVAREK